MTSKEIRNKDDSYLLQELKEKLRHLFDLRTQAVTEKLEDSSQISKTRRHISRIKTILRERQLKIARHADETAATTSALAVAQDGAAGSDASGAAAAGSGT